MNDLIILATLFDGPKHGYQLKREAGFILGHGVMHNNLVYPLLRRFTSDGWVTKKSMPGERGQTRQQYAITALGRRELIARLSESSESDASSFSRFITRVGMFALLEEPVRTRVLQQRESYLQHREERLTAMRQNLDLGIYGGGVVRYLIEQIQSERAWIRRLGRLEGSSKTSFMTGRKK
jgi:DNA-binding PadR family transcriptional regulator